MSSSVMLNAGDRFFKIIRSSRAGQLSRSWYALKLRPLALTIGLHLPSSGMNVWPVWVIRKNFSNIASTDDWEIDGSMIGSRSSCEAEISR